MDEELLKQILEELKKLNEQNKKNADTREKTNVFLQRISNSLITMAQSH